MDLDLEFLRLAVFAGLIAREDELDDWTYIFLWVKSKNVARRIRAVEMRKEALLREVRRHAREQEKEGEAR